jgi:uncharacterized membrane protein
MPIANNKHSSTSGSTLGTPIRRRKHRILFWRKSDINISHELSNDLGGVVSERIAYFLGTPAFILWLTIICVAWLAWNTLAPESLRFDSASLGFTALTLMLSLQASYAAPLILLAQNRQTERDKVAMEQDRSRAERNLADTEFLIREIESLRLQLSEVATRDYVKQELRNIINEERKNSQQIQEES